MSDEQAASETLDSKAVEDFLVEHLPLPGAIQYRSDVDAGGVDPKQITLHAELLLGLRQFKNHFAQKWLAKVLSSVADRKESDWNLADEQAEWATETSKRLRAMLRDISQGLVKLKAKQKSGNDGKPAQWLKPFVSSEEEAAAVTEAKAIEAKGTQSNGDKASLIYKYDEQLLMAYRYPRENLADTAAAREYCLRMEPSGDEMVGVWKTAAWSVPGLSPERYGAVVTGKAPELAPLVATGAGKQKTKKPNLTEWSGPSSCGGQVLVKRCNSKEKKWVILWEKTDQDKKEK